MPKFAPTDALQQCAEELGFVPTRAEYERWRRRLDQPRAVLSVQTITRHQTWSEALAGADLEPRQSQITDALVWSTIRTARQILGAPSVGQYDRWRHQTTPSPRSPAVLTRHTGRSWYELFPPV